MIQASMLCVHPGGWWAYAGTAGQSGMGGGAVVTDCRLGFWEGVSPRPSTFPLGELATQLQVDSGSSEPAVLAHEELVSFSKQDWGFFVSSVLLLSPMGSMCDDISA
jgi:hypothetical protein